MVPSYRWRATKPIAAAGKWRRRNHGETFYEMTQTLTGHACSDYFLYRSKPVSTAEQKTTRCPRRIRQREPLATEPEPEEDVWLEKTVDTIDRWAAFNGFYTRVVRSREFEDRKRSTDMGNPTGGQCKENSGIKTESQRQFVNCRASETMQ